MHTKSISFELKRTNRNVFNFIEAKLKKEQIDCSATGNQRRIMFFLFKNEEKEICQRDIECHFGIASATCSKTLKLLEKNGYVKKTPSSIDQRLKVISLTQKAKNSIEQTKNGIDEIDDQIVENIGQDDLKIFFKVLEQINHNIGKGGQND